MTFEDYVLIYDKVAEEEDFEALQRMALYLCVNACVMDSDVSLADAADMMEYAQVDMGELKRGMH